METYRKIYPSEFYSKFLQHQLRPDGRGLLRSRKTFITLGSFSTAEGSSFVKIGNTAVVAGAKVRDHSFLANFLPSECFWNQK